MTEYRWECSRCHHQNVDDDEYTAVPLCARCDREYDWWVLEDTVGIWEVEKEEDGNTVAA